MLVSESPEYMADWDWETNSSLGIEPDQITTKSRTRVHWVCHVCGGKWDISLRWRRGCPYCNHFKALPGFNDLETLYPDLAKQWVYEKNGTLTPQDVTVGSQKKVFWRCDQGHVWDAFVRCRVQGQGCPYCNNRRVLTGYNDLATTDPEIAEEWDYQKNTGMTPQTINAGSKKKAWWICKKCGYEWQTAICNRHRGNGCPSCAGVIVRESVSDLQTRFPEIAAEWDIENNDKKPSEVAPYSDYRAAWICPKGHSYKAVVADRVKGNNCPECSRERRVSFPEKALVYYISKEFGGTEQNYRSTWLGPYELDAYLPEYRIGIEYDGSYGHSDKKGVERDIRKNKVCSENNVTLVRIREAGCPSTGAKEYIMQKGESLESAIETAIDIIYDLVGKAGTKHQIKPNIAEDSGAIYSLVDYSEKENSLQARLPEVAALWHPTKNGHLKPESVSWMSSKYIWWNGPCGHEWRSRVSGVGRSGLCPYCIGKRVLIGFNDLATTNPDLAVQWDFEKNTGKTPREVTAGSKAKVWWKCSQGHSWKASIASRNRGNGCPICANRIVLKGYNDVASVPELVADWNMEKNTIQPDEICIGSEKKVWWKCHICGNEWMSPVADRYHGRQCPACAQRQRQQTVRKTYVAKSGSLAELRPDLLADWDYDKNTDIQPTNITPGCTRKAWWKCHQCGYSWQTSVAARKRTYGGGCPKCGDKIRAEKRREDLLKKKPPISVTHPQLAAEWDYRKNAELSPDTITSGSGKRIWWKCIHCGSEWQAVVSERTRSKPRGKCPVCSRIQKTAFRVCKQRQ